MVEAQPMPKLTGIVETDETYVGGPIKGRGFKLDGITKSRNWYQTARRRSPVLPRRGCEVRHAGPLHQREHQHDVEVMVTDEFSSYPFAMHKAGMPADKHQDYRAQAASLRNGDIHTNTVESAFSLLKRGIIGSWHRVSAKHLAAYLDEMTWRFNNRKNPFLFRDTMMKLIRSENLEYKELTAA